MSLASIHRRRAPISLLTFVVFAASLLPPRPARADDPDNTDVTPIGHGVGGTPSMGQPSGAAGSADALVTADSSGSAHATLSFKLPHARGAAQPSLALTYDSAAGMGPGGKGWSLNVPSIERRNASGFPNFIDGPPGPPVDPATDPDDYAYGGEPLVPICTIGLGGTCPQSNETFPEQVVDWTYYRTETDSFTRIFHSSNGLVWKVQLKSGVWLTFGVPDDNQHDRSGLETHLPLGPDPVYRWDLVRQTDAHGNVVVYKWAALGPTDGEQPASSTDGLHDLTDIYDTRSPTPASVDILNPAEFAHHTHIFWRGHDTVLRNSPGWKSVPARVIGDVAVTSMPLVAPAGTARSLVRLYELDYTAETAFEQRFLTGFEQEACSMQETNGNIPDPATAGVSCPALVESTVTMAYQTPLGSYQTNIVKTSTIPLPLGAPTGWGGPTYINADLIDVDGDGMSDIIASIAAGPTGVNPMEWTVVQASTGQTSLDFGVDTSTSGPRYAFAQDMFPSRRTAWGDWSGLNEQGALFIDSDFGDPSFARGAPPTQGIYAETYSFNSDGVWPGAGPVLVPDFTKGNQVYASEGVEDSLYWERGKTFDVDGDGLTDITGIQQLLTNPANQRSYFTLRDKSGAIFPHAFERATSHSWPADYNVNGFHAIADMDADGLADLVEVEDTPGASGTGSSSFGNTTWLRWWKNRGDGRFGDGDSSNFEADTGQPSNQAMAFQAIPVATCPACSWPVTQGGANIAVGDVTGDDLADFVVLSGGQLSVYPQVPRAAAKATGVFFYPAITYPKAAPDDNAAVSLADVDGSGSPSIVLTEGATVTTFALAGFPSRDGMTSGNGVLTNLTVGGATGTSSTIAYDSVAHLSKIASPAWKTSLPIPTQVVTSITTSANASVEPDGTPEIYIAAYQYSNPMYDPRDHAFVGFQVVSATQQNGWQSTAGTTRVTTTYAQAGCPSPPCLGVDYGRRMLRGLPLAQQVFDASNGALLQTTVTSYGYEVTQEGADGRGVRTIYPTQVDTFLGEEGQGTATLVSGVGGVASASPTTTSGQTVTTFNQAAPPVLIPTGAGGKGFDIREAQTYDINGNLTATVDFGQVGVDIPIRTAQTWAFPAGDVSGWMYRDRQTLVGYADPTGTTFLPGVLRETALGYDAEGDLMTVGSPLSGTQPLSRSNSSGATAPNPTNASSDTASGALVSLASYTYDAFGQLSRVQRPDGRCSDMSYDSAFDELPTTVYVYRGGCGTAPLTTSFLYNRGLQEVTLATDPTGAVTAKTYDAFGRLTEVDQPNATLLGSTTVPTTATPAALVVDWSSYPKYLHVTTPARESYTYYDSFRRARLHFDSTETAGQWIVSGETQLDLNGRVQKAYVPFVSPLTGVPTTWAAPPTTTAANSSSFTYDSLGRLLTSVGPDGAQVAQLTHHPLSTDILDGEQIAGGLHAGASTTIQLDGHGRTSAVIQHLVRPTKDDVTTASTYLATGEPTVIARTHSAVTSDSFYRTMTYDSLGRLVVNLEPNTGSTGYVLRPGVPAPTTAWRYAYDDAGDLVGTSDARGCGKNLAYDPAGRLVSEDYSPCTAAQGAYSPMAADGTGEEVLYVYDLSELGGNAPQNQGRLGFVYDRGSRSMFEYDMRGRVTSVTKQLAAPGAGSAAFACRYAPHYYEKQITAYDEANRALTATTGADLSVFGLTTAPVVTAHYTPRGTIGKVDGSYGTLLASQSFFPDGSVQQQVFGDVAGTTTDYAYWPTGRPQQIHIHRPKGPWATSNPDYSPSGAVSASLGDLEDLALTYDHVGNPLSVSDSATAAWPAGSFPAARQMAYDDAYHLTAVSTGYNVPSLMTGGDSFSSPPYAPELAAGSTLFPLPAPNVSNRVRSQTYAYDWLGNTTATTDDASAFFDRSLGTITNGGTAHGPNQLVSASQGTSSLNASYDAAGNATNVEVFRGAPCSGTCSNDYEYAWDEVGHLAAASRVDVSKGIVIHSTQAVTETFAYNAAGQRVVKQVTQGSAAPTYDADIFDSLRLEGASFANGDYVRTTESEGQILVAGGSTYGRVLYSESDPVLSASGTRHVFLELGDHLGSTSFVIDQATSELVERPTYQAFGAAESDFRPARWASFREKLRYTGHEDDAEVGLEYFGGRYYSPGMGRWLSADPLTIHGVGGDLNPYAFVRGSPMRFVDPFGFAGCDSSSASCPSPTSTDDPGYSPEPGDGDGEGGGGGPSGGNYASGGTGGLGSGQPGTGAAPGQGANRPVESTPKPVVHPPPPPPPPVTGRADRMPEWNQPTFGHNGFTDEDVGGMAMAPLDPRSQGKKNEDFFLAAAPLILGAVEGLAANAIAASAETSIVDGTSKVIDPEALAARAQEIHGALDPIAQNMRTTAVLETSAGRIVAGGGVDLSPAQRAMLLDGEMAAKAAGVDAEVTSILGARQIGAQLQAIGTTRPFCSACINVIEESGGTITGPNTAVWWLK